MKLVVSGTFVEATQGGEPMADTLRSALSTGTVTSVVLYATPLFTGGRAFEQSLTLDPASGKYEGQILNMKIGEYVFRADAATADGTIVFTGERTFAVQKKQVGLLALMLQQVPAPETVHAAAPRIVAFASSNAAPYFGEVVTLSLTAESRDPGASLTYSWEAVCEDDPAATSEFSSPASATTEFSTTCGGAVVVTGHAHASDTLESAVTMRISYTSQGVIASVALNSWPDITSIQTTDGQAVASQPPFREGLVQVFAAAEDADGDSLRPEWSSSCGGFFEGGGTLAPTFHTPTLPDGECTLTLRVEDGRGGSVTGSVQVWIATPVVISELLYDSLSFDDAPGNTLFVELWSVPGQSLDGFALVAVDGFTGADYRTIDLTGKVIGPDGYFLVAHPQGAESLVAIADLVSTEVDFQNAPDSVQLRSHDVVVDAVAYGVFASTHTIAGEGHPAPDVLPGMSLTRDHAHADTGDNLADFTEATPTPRSAPPPALP